nr:HigA family addiction module antitoxin [Methylobacterium sp. J-048]
MTTTDDKTQPRAHGAETIADLRRVFDQAEAFDALPPVHPGEILREEFMAPFGLSAGAVARALGLPRSRIERIVKEEIGISTDTALRLARLFRTSHQFWLNLQMQFESETLLLVIGDELARITPVPDAA